jgi:hypothetical protein
MYTIGTSSLKYLREQTKSDSAVYHALDKRMLAFVGTQLERDGVPVDPNDPTKYRPATLIAPYSAFFVLSADETQVQLWIPQDSQDLTNQWPLTPDQWVAVGSPFNEKFITESLTPAGGLANGLYATQRGNLADMHLAFKYPGLTYFAKDSREIYVYVDDTVQWVGINLNASDKDPLGSMVIYPEQFALTSVMEANWMRCDGHVMTANEIARFHVFAEFIKGKFTSDPTESKLPAQNNTIIRVSV